MIIIQILADAGQLIFQFAPYVLIGILLAEVLKYTSWTNIIRESIERTPRISIVVASLLGMLSPLSTIGTVPIMIGFYAGGIPLAPLVTFLVASALMNPQLFIITWGSLGGDFVVLRLASITVFTILLGYIVLVSNRRLTALNLLGVNEKLPEISTSNVAKSWQDFTVRKFFHSFFGNLEYVGYYMVLGILTSVIVETIVPLETVLQFTSEQQWLNVLAASVMGIPLYACGGAVIPMLESLIESGMDYGSAIAFLIVGPGTRVTTLMALGSFFTQRMLVIYVAFLLGFSMVVGIVTNLLV